MFLFLQLLIIIWYFAMKKNIDMKIKELYKCVNAEYELNGLALPRMKIQNNHILLQIFDISEAEMIKNISDKIKISGAFIFPYNLKIVLL